MKREISLKRETSETQINLQINLDGKGEANIDTGVPFFNHMLELMAKHGFFDLQIKAKGDIEVDCHHTVEDIGILLGEAFKKTLDEKKGIRRYGFAAVPMDEVLAQVAIDISNRPYLVYNLPIKNGKVGTLDIEVIKEFFQAFSYTAGFTIHINVPYGNNRHHVIEAVFKAFGRAICEAVTLDPRIQGVLSTKGVL
ncbi:MAG: imidazoleglycerol-phosphate dehydratase HisB [Deltaproteobacteria bacterium]|nr:MAG: imidazoleglycerol-phosphate dehydratase HisB [Deltaproteobacteria bacterium]